MINLMSRIVHDWAMRAFGHAHVYHKPVRALRIAEEVVELAQACHVPKDELHKLIEIVYSRPVGEEEREIGSVLLTLGVFCQAFGYLIPELYERELRRVLDKPPSHFTQRNQEKIDLGLTGGDHHAAQAPNEASGSSRTP